MPNLLSRIGLTAALLALSYTASAATGDMRFDPAHLSVNGSTINGLIQVTDGSTWGWVCDDIIDNEPDLSRALEVAERYFNAEHCEESEQYTDSGNSNFILDDVQCNGNESSWYSCSRTNDFSHNCSGIEAFGLVCTGVGGGVSAPIPTLTEWGIGGLGLVLTGLAGWRLRRKIKTSR